MGGKGRRRREKNYRAAHGGNSRLPPPPKPSSLDAVPSKLRKIMSFAAAASGAGKASSNDAVKNKGNADNAVDKVNALKGEGEALNFKVEHMDHGNGAPLDSTSEKNKKKRKQNKVSDLRIEGTEEVGGFGSKRKERKKRRLEEMKKKHKKGMAEDMNFPGREEIKFGDVVEAPPKLVVVPKLLRNTQDASVERLRLQAVEDYRKRKGWVLRPGIQLPPPVTAASMF